MQILRLANEDQTTIIDLINGPFMLRSGFDFQTPGQSGAYTVEPYGAQFDFGSFERQTEVFDLSITGTPKSIRLEVDKLQDFLESVRLFHDGDLAAQSCWLEWSANDEPVKRTLLYSGAFKVISQDNLTPSITDCKNAIGVLSLTRHALWENVETSGLTLIDNTPSLAGGGAYGPVPGNTLARIDTLSMSARAGASLDNFWVGIRRFNQGTANFEPLWECEDGTPNAGNGAAVAADITASGGNKVRVTYALGITALLPRLTMTVAQICAAAGHTDYDHQQGRYLVLLRCMLSAAGTSGIQMRSGYTGNKFSEEVFIDNTVWRLIPIGSISIPPWEGDRYGSDAFAYNFRIDIYSEQLTAGHNLDLDCLILIPNEHMLTLGGCAADLNVRDYTITNEDDTEAFYEYDAVNLRTSDAIEGGMTDWYLPPGYGTIVFAAEDTTTPDKDDTIAGIDFSYYPRWTLYRGV